ncbi:MAG TPA: metal ABC transporter permease [Tepiditoga sp.]|nr:metal ABC transporter permease [Tepiditoga sp.]
MTELFSYDFMVYAVTAALLSGISCSVLSNYIVLKKMEFIGDGAGHTAFGGIALAILMGWNLNLVSVITGVIFALSIYFVSKKQKVNENSIIGILLSLSMALGVIFISLKKGYTPEIDGYLFGDILMVSETDIKILAVVFSAIIISVILFNKELKYYAFNQRMAKIYGVPVNAVNFLFLLTVSVVVVTSVKIIGIILVTALLLTPGIIAKMWAGTLNHMIIISSVVGTVSSVLGIIAAYYFNIPPGPSIVVTMFGFFLISFLLKNIYTKIKK